MEKDNKRLGRVVLLYALLMPSALALCIWLLWSGVKNTVPESSEDTKAEEPEYIYVYVEPEADATDDPSPQALWIVREHEEQIGIFTEDGVLLRTVDVYTKTLPKADQSLLREGITVTSRQDLYALMEDYGA